jgi:hypothetical protein
LAETPRAEIANLMAIASPKKKEELARQFKINPEVNGRLEVFMKANPDLVQYVKDIPREQLERKFLLRKMHDQDQQQGYDAKVKAWLEKPEQAQWVKDKLLTLHKSLSPEKQERALITMAKNHIQNTKIKLS